MKKVFTLLLLACLVILFHSCTHQRSGKPKVLVFSKTAGFRHSSISVGKLAIIKLGEQTNFEVDTTENADWFTDDTLKKYSTVIFLSTTENVLDYRQEAAFERYIQSGGGFVGIHAATDTEYYRGWYVRLVGASFDSHPEQQEAKLLVVDRENIATKHLPAVWVRKDEWYNFTKLNPDVKVLIKIDEKSYKGGTNGDNHPMAWYHDYDGGRAFYTELGHTEESYADPLYLKHLLGGIQYAIGKNEELDYSKAKTQLPPDEDRFVKNVLVQGEFFEPTEMTILPNFDIIVIQRRGEVLLYKNDTKKLKTAGRLDVYFKTKVNTDVNAEEGLLGIAKDPNFKKNNYVYVFYSPADTSVNRLSRFEFKNDSLINSSEKIILQFYSQREICCHTGGSVAFGPDGLLYLSTGDNSTPFDEPNQQYVNHGYAPLNDEPGHEQYDARRTAGNSNDLRGKILRLKIKEDGSYEIPDGNLYTKGTAKTKPEIYVQGDRNPYRISVDQKNSFLYWGEVGPDSDKDSFDTRGPRGYDEVNQARKAGNFGWPYFIGDNYPYYRYDYTTGKTGTKFDPAKPVNDSRNNTGIKDLPPAQPAFIWYPYGYTKYFPQTETGGRNAMAGPVFYSDMYPKETRLPDYYNGKLFIYDWIRGWIKAVSMLPNGDFNKIEPFMEHTKMSNCIDMEMGPDGKIYTLEYGSGWFQKNPDAALSRIDYISGNRAPKVSKITVDKKDGTTPFKVKVSVDAFDPEKDEMTYTWNTGDGKTKETTTPELEYVYKIQGDYSISVTIKDKEGASVKSEAVQVYAGNSTPEVNISINGNKTFYFPGKQVAYSVTASDKEDSTVDKNNFFVSADYIEGLDLAAKPMGHLQGEAGISGKSLTMSLDCKSCHKEAEKSIGPAFIDVAKKYQEQPNARTYLTDKIIKGGGGVWGEVQMAAHPSLPRGDIDQIVSWILGLADSKSVKKTLPQSGNLQSTLGKPVKDKGVLSISASYTDKGGANIKALTGRATALLRNNKILFSGKELMKGFTTISFNEMNYMIAPLSEGWFSLDNIDMTGVGSLTIMAGWQQPPQYGFDFEVRLDNASGKVIGTGALNPPKEKTKGLGFGMIAVPVEAITDGKLHTIYVTAKPKDSKEGGQVGLQFVQFNLK
ncbi:MAG: ThuA domain-containing protein [Sphingobacteriales bacterium]|nr:ThuA domain-containing protein [Sphingobacteriales bacterium]